MGIQIQACSLVLLFLLTVPTYVRAQISRIEPTQPRQGETITVTYDPAAQGAKLKAQDEVYAHGGWTGDVSKPGIHVKLNRAGDVLQAKLRVEPGACYLRLSFVTRHDRDPKAHLSTMIYRQDGVPARGAYRWAMWERYADAVALAQKEIELYPDDLAVYPDKWNFAGGFMKKDERLAMIKSDMALISTKSQRESPEWLYAMSFGYLDLGDDDKARELLATMIERYPTSSLTGYLLGIFQHTVKNPQYKAEAARWQRELVERFPSQNAFGVLDLATQPDFPLAATQAAVRGWTEQEPNSPDAYLALADACYAHHQNYPDAHAALQKAIQLLLAGEYWDGMGPLTIRRLHQAYSDQAEIFLDERNYPQALAAAKAAEGFETDVQARGEILEGKVWEAFSDNGRAEAAYLEAWRRDPEGSEPTLKQFYEASRGNLDGFQQYLDSHRSVESGKQEGKKKPAPSFQAVSLDGEPLSLTGLRGKVIVLNFWFVGCAACMAEIPELNRLVQQFKDQGVVFIGFALDHEEQLRSFLKKIPFSYKVVPNSADIANQFAVPEYPTHVLINQNCEIEVKLVGGEKLDALEAQLKQTVQHSSTHQ